MFNKLFKLADKLERKWFLSKYASQVGADNYAKIYNAYTALTRIVAFLEDQNIGSKCPDPNKSDVIHMRDQLRPIMEGSQSPNPLWITRQGKKYFQDNMTMIQIVVRDIKASFEITQSSNQSVMTKNKILVDICMDAIAENIQAITDIPNAPSAQHLWKGHRLR